MFFLNRNKSKTWKQLLVAVAVIMLVAGICFSVSAYLGYRIVALILLTAVSFTAMFFDIIPVLIAAVLSALIWDFLFIPPRFTFQVSEPEDALMLLMYFLVALVNAVLTYKVRSMEKQMQKEEERANLVRFYNTILNSLSHELRTPIATIIGSSDNLLQQEEKLSADDKKNLLGEISVAAVRLNRQVENLLNISRLESGIIRPRPDWCDLRELVHGVLNQLDEQLRGHSVNVQLDEKIPLVRLDFGLTEQALYNLVYNAAMHTPAGTAIAVKAECNDSSCTIVVADNGPGFPEEEMKNVFGKFYRLKNSKPGGTGLGLSIAKGFIEAQGGTIRLENAVPSGAVFTISLPADTSYLNNLKNE